MYCALFSLCAQAQAPHLFSCVEGWQLLLSDYPVSSQVMFNCCKCTYLLPTSSPVTFWPSTIVNDPIPKRQTKKVQLDENWNGEKMACLSLCSRNKVFRTLQFSWLGHWVNIHDRKHHKQSIRVFNYWVIILPGRIRFFKISVPVADAFIKQILAPSRASCPWSPHNLTKKHLLILTDNVRSRIFSKLKNYLIILFTLVVIQSSPLI